MVYPWYLRQRIEKTCLPQLEALHRASRDRLLPTFDQIDQEADAARAESWARFESQGDPDADPASAVERAIEAGLDRYDLLSGVRQGLLNLEAVALRHLLEQQQLVVLRAELLERGESCEVNVKEFGRRLELLGIEPRGLGCWNDLEELRLVSNVVKHAVALNHQASVLFWQELLGCLPQ